MSGINGNYGSYGQYSQRPVHHHRPSPEKILEETDTDGDNQISQQEFLAFQPKGPNGVNSSRPAPTDAMKEAMFTKWDTDGDGQLTETELQNAAPPGPPPGAQGSGDPEKLAAMQQHRQLVDQTFGQYGLNASDIFKEVKEASGSEQPLPPDQMEATLSQVLQNHGLTENQVTTVLGQLRPPNAQ